MFEDFAHVWTPVALGEELKPGATLAVQVAGTPVVLFRDRAGRASALVDRCPHRGVKLSLGTVQDGCIQCPFHGWRLDGAGKVCAVPWNPDARLATLAGRSLATRELGGQLWIYTAPDVVPPSEPAVHESLLAPGVRVSALTLTWDAHWTRAMENMLDWPHLPFVHRSTIGRAMAKKPDARMDITHEAHPWGMHTTIAIDGEAQHGSLDLRWPNQMNLHIGSGARLMMMMVACVPIDDRRTRMILAMARNYLTSRVWDWAFNLANQRIAAEDRAIVESSHPVKVPPPAEEQSVRTDAPTLLFRKRYFAELAGSRADANAAR